MKHEMESISIVVAVEAVAVGAGAAAAAGIEAVGAGIVDNSSLKGSHPQGFVGSPGFSDVDVDGGRAKSLTVASSSSGNSVEEN